MDAWITDIKRFAVHDGDGIRTTIFFKGCPLKCVWCHNPESLSHKIELAYWAHKCQNCGSCAELCGANVFTDGDHSFLRENCDLCGKCVEECPSDAFKIYGTTISVEELLTLALEDLCYYQASGGGVTLSGGECLMQSEACAELLRLLKKQGIHTAVDTCGFVSRQAVDLVTPYTDVFLYDIKAVDPDVHIRCTGYPNRQILDNLHHIDALGKRIEVRIPYVPGYNDGQMDKIARLLTTLKSLVGVRVLRYHNFAASKYDSLGLENTLPRELPKDTDVERVKTMMRSLELPVLD